MPHKFLAATGLKMFNYDLFNYSSSLVNPKHGSKGDEIISIIIGIYFSILRALSKILYKLLRVKLPDTYYHPSLGQDIIW